MADTKDDWQEIPLNEVDDWEEVKDSPAQAVLPELPGMLESAGRGAMQGLSFGWADEIQAKTEELFGGENYDKRLAEIREANKLAAETNPISYYGADILSGFALPIGSLGAAAKGAGMLAKAGKAAKAGAVIGGVTGAGTSEGTTSSEVAADALMGGTAGAVAGPLLEGAVGGVKGLMNRTGSKVGAIADVKDFYKYGKEGVELSGPDALRRVTGEGFETVEKELIPQLEKSIKVKNSLS